MSHLTLFGLTMLLITAPSFAQTAAKTTNAPKNQLNAPPSNVQNQGAQRFIGKWTCIPGDFNAKFMNLDFNTDGTMAFQVVGGNSGTLTYTTNGSNLLFGTEPPQEYGFVGNDAFALAAPVLHGQTCRRVIPMPVQAFTDHPRG